MQFFKADRNPTPTERYGESSIQPFHTCMQVITRNKPLVRTIHILFLPLSASKIHLQRDTRPFLPPISLLISPRICTSRASSTLSDYFLQRALLISAHTRHHDLKGGLLQRCELEYPGGCFAVDFFAFELCSLKQDGEQQGKVIWKVRDGNRASIGGERVGDNGARW